MKKKRKISSNYLDFIPVLCETLKFTIDDKGLVTIFMENKGVFHFLAQKLFKKPPVSQIHLDEMGSFIWTLIDGKRTVYEIAQQVQEHFGEKAEPLYQRLVQYIRTLENCNFIVIK